MHDESYPPVPARHFAVARGESANASASAAKGVQLSDLVLVLRRWWWKCLLAGTLSAIIAVSVVWLTFEPAYQATAYLKILMQSPYLAYPSMGESQAFRETQLELIRTIVLDKVIAEPEVARLRDAQDAEFPLEWLKKALRAGYVGGSELFQISFQSSDPAGAALVANSVMDNYLQVHRDQLAEQTEQTVKLLREEKAKRAAEVELYRERVRTLTRQNSGRDNPKLAQLGRQGPLAGMEEQRAGADVERTVLRARLVANQERIKFKRVEVLESAVSSALDLHPQIEALREQEAAARNDLRLRLQRLPEGKPDAKAASISREIQELEKSLEQALAELRPQVLDALVAAELDKLTAANTELEASIERQEQLHKVWTDQIDEQRKKLEEQGEESLELEFARIDLERSQQVFQRLSDRISVLLTEVDAPSRVKELQRAKTPPAPLESLPFKRFAMAVLGALGFPFGLALLWERWVRRISDADQMQGEVNVPVLGEIFTLPKRSLVPTFGSNDRLLRDRCTFEESVDSLRVGLTLAPELHDLQVLAVTSAISQEGKTSLVSSLAISLAKGTNESILVIDTDTRAPDLHQVFDIPLEPGLVDVLEGSHSLESAIVTDAVDGLHLLPAGELRSNPHQLLRNGEFASLLEGLRTRYRYIIIDTPPVLLASETLVIARACDGALICTMRDFSRGAQLRRARERLAAAGVRLLGAVINGVPAPGWYQKYGGYLYSGRTYETQGNPGPKQVQP